MTLLKTAGQMPFDYGHEASHLEADFIEGEGNALALAHIRAYPDWPGPLTLIEGPAKSGKSHLARIWAERAGAVVTGPKAVLADIPPDVPLLVEDVDRSGFDEPALFHLLNRSMREGRPVLMTARDAVANWPFATDDLKSRARLAARFALVLSDDIQLSQMLLKLFHDRQVSVDQQVIRYLVARMERSAEEAVALAGLADHIALSRGTAITRAVAAEALAQRGVAQHELDRESEDDE